MGRAKPNRTRKSLSLPRFTPDEGTTLALVADYYNDLPSDERSTLIRELLMMCLLPLAKSKSGQFTHHQVRDAYLIARRMAENHFGIMAIELGLDASVYAYIPQPLERSAVFNGNENSGMRLPDVEVPEEESATSDESSMSIKLDLEFMNSLFD